MAACSAIVRALVEAGQVFDFKQTPWLSLPAEQLLSLQPAVLLL
jgi:hypothetical protein